MNIPKAIEILTIWQNGGDITSFDDVNTAANLGIEALIRERNNRINPGAYQDIPLPGETQE